MALAFLSSRTEVLRALSLDTGRSLLLIGAPKEFRDYIEKVVPAGSALLESEDMVKEGALFRTIVLWAGDRPERLDSLGSLLQYLARDGNLWTIAGRGYEGRSSIIELSKASPPHGLEGIPITTSLDLVPVLIREPNL